MHIQFLSQEASVFLLIFARIGSIFMLLPGFSYTAVSPRIRLAIALSITLVLYPILAPSFSTIRTDGQYLFLLLNEALLGLMIGTLIKMLTSTLDYAGTVIAYHSGMAFALIADPSNNGQQSSIFTGFLVLVALLLIFTLNIHHIMLMGLKSSYTYFPALQPLKVEIFSSHLVNIMGQSLLIGLKISAPFIFFSLIFNAGLGILSRLMPQLQVFFIIMPLNITISFLLLMLLLGVIMNSYIDYFSTMLAQITGIQ